MGDFCQDQWTLGFVSKRVSAVESLFSGRSIRDQTLGPKFGGLSHLLRPVFIRPRLVEGIVGFPE